MWLLDEPYDALDAEGTAMLDAALSAHAARGGAAVLTSHIDLTLCASRRRSCCSSMPTTVCNEQRVFATIVARDLRLAARRRVEALLPIAFFLVAVSLFPLGVGPEPQTLRQIAPGVVWVCALLAAMLSLTQLYGGDHADGSLEQMLLSGESAVADRRRQGAGALDRDRCAAGAGGAPLRRAVRPRAAANLRCWR